MQQGDMYSFLDDYAHHNNLRNANTKLKVLFAISTLVLSVFSASPITPFIIFIVMAFLTISVAKIPAKFYFKWFSGPIFFTLPVFIIMIFFFGTITWASFNVFGYKLTAYRDGFNLGLLLVSRVLSGTSCLFFLAFTTPMIELFSVLKLLKVPDIVVELSMMMYRYIFVLFDEALRMHNAQKIRLGCLNFKSAVDSFSLLASNLFIKAWERGERLYVAMDSRCYSGKIELLEEDKPIPKLQLAALIVLEGIFVAITYLTRDFKWI
jgi:cobalt/nickel transport system permease protein